MAEANFYGFALKIPPLAGMQTFASICLPGSRSNCVGVVVWPFSDYSPVSLAKAFDRANSYAVNHFVFQPAAAPLGRLGCVANPFFMISNGMTSPPFCLFRFVLHTGH